MRKNAVKALLASTVFAASGMLWSSNANAEVVTYTIDPLQSTLTLLGNLTGNPASQQTAGSLSTSYSGTIVADRNPGNIRFTGGSVLNALTQPSNQQPRNDATPGSQAADYGRTAPGPFGSTTLEAIRDLQLDLFDDTSGLGATVAGNGTFPSNSFGVDIDNGESDSIFGTVPNEVDLSGKGTANANTNPSSSVVVSSNIETLTLRFSTGAVGYNIAATGDSTISFNGTIVATREIIPEPSAIGGTMLLGAGLLARRRRSRQ